LGGQTQEAILTTHYHAVVWIDHHEAHVFHFNAEQADEAIVHATHSPHHLHGKAGSASGTHVTNDPEFYHEVAGAVADAQAILITGPSSAKTEFVKYLHKHAPSTAERISGIETMARVTDNQLMAEARRYFSQADRMQPQNG
jgi:stalled ribosome rescue protein Dom34